MRARNNCCAFLKRSSFVDEIATREVMYEKAARRRLLQYAGLSLPND